MLCYSTGSLPDGFTASQIAAALLPTPFRGVEFVVTPDTLVRAGDTGFWRGFRLELESRGLRVRNVHLGAPYLLGPAAHRPGLGAPDPAGRTRRIGAALAACRIAENLGSAYMTVTTGLPTHAADFAAEEVRVFAALEEIVAGRPRSVRVAVEQEPEHLIHATAQLRSLCRRFPGEVFANFDVGHSAVEGEEIAACLRTLAPHLSNVHLEDIRGRVHRHLLFGDGDVDFTAVFAALTEGGYAGDLTPDLYPFKDDWRRALRASAEFLARNGFYA